MSEKQSRTSDEHRRWAVAAMTLAVNLGSFLFLVLVARSAPPALFGALAALAGITLLCEVPASALQVVVGNRFADSRAAAREPTVVAGPLLVDTIAWGAGVCVVLLALSPLVEHFLHLPSVSSALLLAGYALPVGIGVVPKASLVAEGKLALLATGLVGGTLVRVVAGVLLVRHGDGLDGAMAAMVVGEVVSATIVLPGLRDMLAHPAPRRAAQPLTVDQRPAHAPAAGAPPGDGAAPAHAGWGDAKVPALAFSGYWALTAADVVLARHWLASQASGWYAASATVADVALIAPAAVAAVAFPRLVGAQVPRLVGPDSRPNQRLMFALACAAVAAIGLVAAVSVSLLSRGTVRAFFGHAYGPASTVAGLLTFTGALTGLVMVLLHYHLSLRARFTANLCWPGIVISVVGTAIWHRSMTEVAVVMLVSTSLVCAGMLFVAWGRAELPKALLAERAQLALLDATLDLTVVVPYYNPGKLLVPNIERLVTVLDAAGASYEVIAVCDGATDGSERELDAFLAGRPGPVTNVVLARNQGKGAALRIGLARGRGRYLGFIDADGDLDPLLLDSFQTMVRLYTPDIILGSKRHPLSEVEYPLLRRAYSWGYQQVVRAGFRLNIKDTQTGIKLVRRDVLAAVLPRMVEKRFAFDLELFVIARRLGYKRFLEAPIRLRHQFTSTVSWRSVYRSLLDTMAIWYRLRILHFYDGDQAPATPGGEDLRIEPVLLRGSAGSSVPTPAALNAASADKPPAELGAQARAHQGP